MRRVLRERGVSLGDREVEDECLILMAQRLQEASGLRLLPWLVAEEGRLCVAGD
jgi:hypothetical protein